MMNEPRFRVGQAVEVNGNVTPYPGEDGRIIEYDALDPAQPYRVYLTKFAIMRWYAEDDLTKVGARPPEKKV